MTKEQMAVKEAVARYSVSVTNAQGVPLGYKQTEVGIVPEDWRTTQLELISAFITKGSTPTTYGFDWEKDGVLFLRSECVSDEGLDLTQSMFISLEAHKLLRRSEVRAGDILITITGNVGRVIYLDKNFGNANINQHIARIRVVTANVYSPYIFYYLSQSTIRKYYSSITTGQAYPQISLKQVRDTKVPLPPIPEQRAIATALADVDTLIAALDKLIAKKRAIKTAAMQQLLTGKQRLPGFGKSTSYKQTEVGQIPEDWESTPLGKISTFITKGATPTTYGFGWERDGILFLRSECVSQDGLDLNQSMFISPEAHNALRRSEVRSGDLLITITGNVGRVIYLRKDFVEGNINQHIARIRIKDVNVCIEFVFHFFSQSSTRKYYESITTGQAYPQISLRQVRDTIVPLPTLSEQRAIALALSDMDAEIAALEARRDKIQAIKQGMMQELLIGKTRLIENGQVKMDN